MKPRTTSRLAWGLWAAIPAALIVSALIPALTRSTLDTGAFTFIVPIFLLSFATVGALVASRRPGNAIGWILLVTAVVWSLVGLGDTYADHAAQLGQTDAFLARLADWPNLWFYASGIFGPITLVLLLFPNGSPPSARWRPIVWITAIGNLVLAFTLAFDPETTAGDARFLQSNPFGIRVAAGVIHIVGQVVWFATFGALVASAIGIGVRLRRARGEERTQLKWLAASGILVVVTILASIVVGSATGWQSNSSVELATQLVIVVVLTTIPVSAGIAILKYRLYDIDVVINKAVVYGLLAGVVTLVYVAIVVGIGTAVGAGGSPFLSAVAAAVVALLFQPARRWAQRLANRVVYGKRATPYQVLSGFSERVAEAYSVDDVLPRMAAVIAEGTGASRTRIWLAVASELRPVASWPEEETPATAVPSVEDLPDRPFEVRHQGEPLGAITVAMPPSEPMTPAQEQLISDLAAQAGLVLRNARLVEELRDSRRRIVAAQDERAKKLERNIHDGAQQQLVALAVKLGLVERMVSADARKAAAMLEEAKAETNDALETLRDLARGIYPPLLADQGLAAALGSQARKSPVPVEIEPDGIGRYPQETEAAVYFSCLEALQNVAKYARATHATIRLSQTDRALTFEVTDDGEGFEPSSASRGTGLQGIADRLAALGGTLDVRSGPGEGTTVAGRLPVSR